MTQKTLTPQQIEKISEVDSLVLRQRYALYVQLPNDLQEVMFAEKTTKVIWGLISGKYNLGDREVKIISKTVGLVLLGEISIKNLISQLSKMLGIDTNKAQQIAQDINQQIFQPVRKSLMEVHGIKSDNRLNVSSKQRVVSSEKIIEPKPVSMEELEGMNKSRAPSDQHVIPSELGDETEKRRERLLEKLKQDRGEKKTIDLSDKTLPKKKRVQSLNETQDKQNPQAITTAWDGRTIDLTKIPPRRKSTRKKHKRIKVHEA